MVIGQTTSESILITVGAERKIAFVDGHHVDANVGCKRHLPVILRNARHNVVMRSFPTLREISIFNPHTRRFERRPISNACILRKHRTLGFDAFLQNVALVFHQVLNGYARGYHVRTRAVMVELASRQRQDNHFQVSQFVIGFRRVITQRTAKFAIEVVSSGHLQCVSARCFGLLRAISRFADKFHHRFVRQQPHPDVHEQQMRRHEFGLHLGRRLLQHKIKFRRAFTVHKEHPVMRSLLRVGPQSVAHHIGLGDVLQRSSSSEQHIAAGNERTQCFGSFMHDARVKRQLQFEQRLIDALSTRPSEHGNGRQYFSTRSVCR